MNFKKNIRFKFLILSTLFFAKKSQWTFHLSRDKKFYFVDFFAGTRFSGAICCSCCCSRNMVGKKRKLDHNVFNKSGENAVRTKREKKWRLRERERKKERETERERWGERDTNSMCVCEREWERERVRERECERERKIDWSRKPTKNKLQDPNLTLQTLSLNDQELKYFEQR